jgi:hypothetical protein
MAVDWLEKARVGKSLLESALYRESSVGRKVRCWIACLQSPATRAERTPFWSLRLRVQRSTLIFANASCYRNLQSRLRDEPFRRRPHPRRTPWPCSSICLLRETLQHNVTTTLYARLECHQRKRQTAQWNINILGPRCRTTSG